MAHKKGAGSTRNGRDSESKRLGVKIYGGQHAIAGNIIVRQRGTKFHPSNGVGLGKDHTLYALTDGIVTFTKKKNNRSYVSVLNEEKYALFVENRQGNGNGNSEKVEAPVAEAPATETKPEAKTKTKKSAAAEETSTEVENKAEETQNNTEDTSSENTDAETDAEKNEE